MNDGSSFLLNCYALKSTNSTTNSIGRISANRNEKTLSITNYFPGLHTDPCLKCRLPRVLFHAVQLTGILCQMYATIVVGIQQKMESAAAVSRMRRSVDAAETGSRNGGRAIPTSGADFHAAAQHHYHSCFLQ